MPSQIRRRRSSLRRTPFLAKVRETYRTLTNYHFERVLRAEEAKEDGKLKTTSELTLALASENAKLLPEAERLLPINLDRFRTDIAGQPLLWPLREA